MPVWVGDEVYRVRWLGKKPSFSGDDVDASPLDESDTVTIELDSPLRAFMVKLIRK